MELRREWSGPGGSGQAQDEVAVAQGSKKALDWGWASKGSKLKWGSVTLEVLQWPGYLGPGVWLRRGLGTTEYCDMSQPASLVYGALVLVTVGCESVGEAVGAKQAVIGG